MFLPSKDFNKAIRLII